jgi:lipopolysaccharide biosynthesis glycosyltransferase
MTIMPSDEPQVLCACDERYLPHAATMLCSLLEHNRVSRIHLFYSEVNSAELLKLESLVGKYNSEVAFYKIMPADLDNLHVDTWASLAVYYRLLAPRLLPADVNKILYLDSDIIIRKPLAALWNLDLAGKALAAVANYEDDARRALGLPEDARYFNSGVLLINLKFWRERDVAANAIAYVRANPHKVQYWDQDALNATLINQWIELSPYWNSQCEAHGTRDVGSQKLNGPAIVHFCTPDKPWQWSNNHPFKSEYRKYRLKTPWSQYIEDGRPGLTLRVYHALRRGARLVMPRGMRMWLRPRLVPRS